MGNTNSLEQLAHDAANMSPIYRAAAAINRGEDVGEVLNEGLNPLNQLDANVNATRTFGGDKVPLVSQALQATHTAVREAKDATERANSKAATGIALVCSEVCRQSYKKEPTNPIKVHDSNKCWKLLDYRKTNCIAYSCGGNLIVGIKGTNAEKHSDIAANIAMVLRMNDATGRFTEADNFINSTVRNGSKWKKIYLTGHSLGGSIVYDSFSNSTECTECHMFNPYFKGANDCNGRKVFLHRTLGDPVSNSWPTVAGVTVKTYKWPDDNNCHMTIGGQKSM